MGAEYDVDGIDPLDLAARDTVREYVDPVTGRRGAQALALALGVPYSTVQNKSNPHETYTSFNLKEARAVILRTGDKRMLHQLAHDVGEACVPLPVLEFPADSDLMLAWAEWQGEVAETVRAAKEALADHKITRDEVERIRLELMQDFEKGLAMLDVFKGMMEPESERDGSVVVRMRK